MCVLCNCLVGKVIYMKWSHAKWYDLFSKSVMKEFLLDKKE